MDLLDDLKEEAAEQEGDVGVGLDSAFTADLLRRAGTAIEDLRAALRDCMDYVDVDSLTTQTNYRNWKDVLKGQPGK